MAPNWASIVQGQEQCGNSWALGGFLFLLNLSSSFLPQVIVWPSALSSSSSFWTPFRKGTIVIRSRGDTSMDLVQPSCGDTVVGTNITKSPTRARTLYACPQSLHQGQKGASFWVVVLEHTCSLLPNDVQLSSTTSNPHSQTQVTVWDLHVDLSNDSNIRTLCLLGHIQLPISLDPISLKDASPLSPDHRCSRRFLG